MASNEMVDAIRAGIATRMRLLRDRIAAVEEGTAFDGDDAPSLTGVAEMLSALHHELKLMEQEMDRLNADGT